MRENDKLEFGECSRSASVLRMTGPTGFTRDKPGMHACFLVQFTGHVQVTRQTAVLHPNLGPERGMAGGTFPLQISVAADTAKSCSPTPIAQGSGAEDCVAASCRGNENNNCRQNGRGETARS